MAKISPQEALQKVQNEQAHLIDVRTPAEFRAIHAVGAENHDLSKLNAEYINEHILSGVSGRPLLLLCKSGHRASMAAELFQKLNTPKVFVVDGGTDWWNEQG